MESKHFLQEAWGKLGAFKDNHCLAFKDNHCNTNCVKTKYACSHEHQLKSTKEYSAATNTMNVGNKIC